MTIKINSLMAEVLRLGGSDLHMGVGHEPCIRVDGELHPVQGAPVLTAEDVERAISEILLPEQMAVYRENSSTTSASHSSRRGRRGPVQGNGFFESGNWPLPSGSSP